MHQQAVPQPSQTNPRWPGYTAGALACHLVVLSAPALPRPAVLYFICKNYHEARISITFLRSHGSRHKSLSRGTPSLSWAVKFLLVPVDPRWSFQQLQWSFQQLLQLCYLLPKTSLSASPVPLSHSILCSMRALGPLIVCVRPPVASEGLPPRLRPGCDSGSTASSLTAPPQNPGVVGCNLSRGGLSVWVLAKISTLSLRACNSSFLSAMASSYSISWLQFIRHNLLYCSFPSLYL